VLKHEGRDAGGAHDGDTLFQSAEVNIALEDPKGSGNLPLVLRFNARMKGIHLCRRRKGVGLYGKDGDRGTLQAFEETLHLRHRLETAGEDDAGNPRVRGSRIGHERRDHDVGTVTGGDDEAAFFQMIQKVGQFHGRYLVMSHFPVKPLDVSVQHFGSESPLDFADRGLVEERVGRQDEHRNPGTPTFPKTGHRLSRVIGCNPVDDDRKDVALLCFQGFRQYAHGIHDLPGFPSLSGDNRHERCTEVSSNFGVELELQRRLHALVIGARADHQVKLLLEGPVLFEDPALQLLFLAPRDQVPDRGIGDPKNIVAGDRDVVPARDECAQVIDTRSFFGHGTEEAEFPTMPRQQFHHPEHDDGFPAPRPRPSDVDAF